MNKQDLVKHWRFRVHRVQLAHYDATRLYNNRHLRLGIPAVVLSVIVGTSVFGSLSKSAESNEIIVIIVGLFSVTSAVLTGLQTFLQYSELAEKHRIAGARLAHLKHEIELLATLPPNNDEELKTKLEQIETQWAKFREDSPNIPDKLWKKIELNLTYEMHEKKYGSLAENV
ncbi:SLATT domain-containing protein [Candidatus Thiosymbion oneisti]|uniref:SLATT domain-containing protein n=1 Tax=Candidatus Thiosymbion oneisti TaxID=589554 RepID=UPI00105E5898|nr:SLATT domain-containing protein [Candidatus Thiosymbion oneisti]